MRRSLPIFLLTALSVAACSGELPHESPFDPDSPAAKQAKASLTGKVTLENETDYSQVTLQLQNAERTYSVQTLADGSISLTGIVPGTYQLNLGTRYFEPVSRDITLELASAADLGVVALKAKRGAVFGKAVVEDEDGNQSGGVAITLRRSGSVRSAGGAPAFAPQAAGEATAPTVVVTGESSADGSYTLADVPAGVYELTAVKSGAGSLKLAKVQVTGEDGAVEVKELVLLPMFGNLTIAGKNPAGKVNTQTVTLELNATGSPSYFEVAQDPLFVSSAGRQPYAFTTTYDLGPGDGPRTLYVRYFDEFGVESTVGSDFVVLDTTPPQLANFTITNGAYTKTATVNLQYAAVDAATYTVSSNACGGSGVAVQASGLATFPLPVSDPSNALGDVYTVAMQFFDDVGNGTACLTRDVTFDNVAPQITSVNAPTAVSTNTITFTFAVDFANRVKIGETVSLADVDWQPFDGSPKNYLLSAGNGTKTVYLQFSDAAGNVAGTSKVVVLDTTPPTNPFIAAAAPVTAGATVQLSLSAGLVSEMIVSESSTFSGASWETYAPAKTFTLSAGDGTKTIYAKFKKSSGVETSVVSTSVIRDATAPILPSVRVNNGAAVVDAAIVTLNLSAVDETSGLATFKVNSANSFGSVAPKTYQTTDVYTLSGGDGAKTVWVVYGDKAGNYSAAASTSVVLDTTNPVVGSVALQTLDGAAVTNGATVRESRVRLVSGVSDLTALEMQVSTNGSFTGVAWEPYSASKVIDLPSSGTPTITARVRDQAGRVTTLLAGINVSIDTVAPVGTASRLSPAVTNATGVSLLITANETSDTQVSEDPAFAGAAWFATASTTFTLGAGDGLRTIYVRWRDAAGNVSAAKTVQVTLDQTPPQLASFSIGEGAETNSQTVSLVLSAAGADWMQVTESASCGGAWEAYATSKGFTFGSATNETKTISVRFKDNAGNLTGCLTRTIAFDDQAPTFTAGKGVVINNDDAFTTSRTVSLALNVTGAMEVQVSESSTFVGAAWQAAVTTMTFTLSAGEGTKTVYLRARDAAGNTTATQSDTVSVDTIAPSFNTASGPSISAVEAISLSLSASGATKMRLSELPGFSDTSYGAYNATAPFTLGSTEGVHTIYVQLADDAGNESLVRSVTVTLDKSAPSAPVVSVVGGAYTTTANVTLQILADGATEMLVSQYAPMTDATWQPFSSLKSFTLAGGDGAKTLYVRVRDGAGNTSAASSATVTQDGTAPNVTLFRAEDAGGAVITQSNTARFYLRLAASDASPLSVQFNTSNAWSGVPAEALQTLRAWDAAPPTLAAGESRNVYVRVADAAGNATVAGPVTVLVDTIAPTSPSLAVAPALVSSPTVAVTLGANNADTVELSEDISFLAPLVIGYTTSTNYTFLNTSDGVKTLYARYVDALGNYSGIVVASATLDQTPPQLAGFTIRQGALTRLRDLDLDLTALGASEMSIAEAATCAGPWIAFETYKQLTFAADVDGLKYVSAKFRDAAGNQTACITKTISYDKTPPVAGLFQINGGAAYARERAVSLSIAVSGASEMQISETPVFSGAWQPVTSSANHTLSAGDGAKTLYLQFRDAAGNTAQAAPATIQLDTAAPEQPLVVVNDGSGYARQITAALTLSATGSPSHYRWTVDGVIDNKPWLAFTTSTSVSLGAGADGQRAVAVQFKDPAGNVSLTAQAAVYLDRVAPTAPLVRVDDGAATTTNLSGLVTLALNAADTGSGLSTVRLAASQGGLAGATPLPFEPTKVYTLDTPGVDGYKQVWASFYDKAGNYSAPVSAVIRLDRTPPAAALSFPGGALTSTGVMSVAVAADADTALMQVSNHPAFADAPWQPYAASFTYLFPAVHGPATLYARFRDDAGNESGTFTLGLFVDTAAPVVGGVSGAVVSDSLVWDDLASGVTSYTVYLYNGGVAVAATTTTQKRLYVGRMDPGFTVVANYADGTQTMFSQAPGYAVPPTFAALLGLRADAATNALVARLAQQYGLGTTTTGCAQVVFTNNAYDDAAGTPASGPGGGVASGGSAGPSCGGTNKIRILADNYSDTPPGFDAAIAPVAGNPFAGLPALRVSGGGRGYYSSPSANPQTKLLTVPGDLRWPGGEYAMATTGDAVISAGAYNPASGTGANDFRVFFPLAALAVTDDVSVSYWAASTEPTAFGFIDNNGFSIATAGKFAGLDVTSATFRNRYYESFVAMNGLYDPSGSNYWNIPFKGALQLPFYPSDATYDAASVSVSSVWPYCNYYYDPDPMIGWIYECENIGSQVVVDFAASTLTMLNQEPWYDSNWDTVRVANADGTRSYRFHFPNDGGATVYWRNEYEQPAVEAYLRAMIKRVAAPVRVRGTGIPVLTNNVAGATEMMVGLDAAFTGAAWEAYAGEVTLPEGTQTVWVKYRDDAGNVTPAQQVAIAAPEEAPRLDEAVILGTAGNPGYTTGAEVDAYLLGTFPSAVQVRVSTTPTFDDAGWVVPEGPLEKLELTDPLTGEVKEAELEGTQVVRVPITIPATPGTYTYYFWLKDASRNFSRMGSASIVFDTAVPDAEFSLKPGETGSFRVQGRWTVTKTPILPSLASLSPAAVTTHTLPFQMPFLNTASSTLWIDDAKACLQVGYLSACALEKLTNIQDYSVTLSAQQAVVVWRGHGPYGTPVTTAATLLADGTVRLSYWNTGARIRMRGQVDLVETPYADFDYAAVLGSVEYRPNALPMQLLLRSQSGELIKVTVPKNEVDEQSDGYWQVNSPWRTIYPEERGMLRLTGTAFSMAGAPGRVTVRDVYVHDGEYDDAMLDQVEVVPVTDTRYWLTWALGDDNVSTLFRLDGAQVGAGAVASGMQDGVGRLAESHQFRSEPYERGRSQWPIYNMQGRTTSFNYGPTFVVTDDGAVPSSGVPVTPDFASRLMYGADGSIWDLSDPRRPTPVRVFGGSYPFIHGTVARAGNHIWTGNGIWDVSSPEAPVKVAATQSARSSYFAFEDRVFEINGWNYWVYDAAYPASAPTSGWMSTQGANDVVLAAGAKLLSPAWDLIAIDLTAGLLDGAIAGYVGEYNGFIDAGQTVGWPWAAAGLGFARYYSEGGLVTPHFENAYSVDGKPLIWDVRRLTAAGPWIYGTGTDALRVGHVGRALPDRMSNLYTSTSNAGSLMVAADSRYTYVCDDKTLKLYDASGALAKSGTVRGCYGELRLLYPYVHIDAYRYRIDGANFTESKLTFCDPFSDSSYCPEGTLIGTAIRDWNRKLWTGEKNLIELSDPNCEPVRATDSLVFCYDYGTGDIKAGPVSSLPYRGVVTGPNTIPVARLLNDGANQITDAWGEYLSTPAATYFVRGLQDVVAVGPANLKFVAPGFAADEQGTLYELDGEAVRVVAKTNLNARLIPTAGGRLTAAHSTQVWTSRWGPGLPEFRLEIPLTEHARDMVASAGYVYYATPGGIARTDGLTQAATAEMRYDLTVRHVGDAWRLYSADRKPITTVVEAAPGLLADLCAGDLRRTYRDPDSPWNPPVEAICNVTDNVPTDHVFQGDLGRQWLALKGMSLESIGDVSSLAVDAVGRVYAGVQTGATGVYMYDPADTALAAVDYLATGPVLDLAVDGRRIFVVLEDGTLETYDLVTGALLWQAAGNSFVRVRAAQGYVAANANGWGLTTYDQATGAPVSFCGGGSDFALSTRRWGGASRPVIVQAGWSYVEVLDALSCNAIELMDVPTSNLQSIRRDSGFLFVSDDAGRLFVTQEGDFTGKHVFTVIAGPAPAYEGVIVGPFVYTMGTGSGQIFQLH